MPLISLIAERISVGDESWRGFYSGRCLRASQYPQSQALPYIYCFNFANF